jgi:hypothetical protein
MFTDGYKDPFHHWVAETLTLWNEVTPPAESVNEYLSRRWVVDQVKFGAPPCSGHPGNVRTLLRFESVVMLRLDGEFVTW